MSNTNGPNGFRAANRVDGAPQNYGLTTSYCANAAGAIFWGDPLIITNGLVTQAAVVPGGQTLAGVMGTEAKWVSKTFNRTVYNQYWPGTADSAQAAVVELKTVTDPFAYFETQTTGTSGAALTQSSVGKFLNYNAGGGGNTANGISSYSADDNTVSTIQGNLPLKVVWIEQPPVTDQTSQYNRIRVQLANLNQGV